MKWQGETFSMYWDRVTQWHPWFAWYPVIDEKGVWHWLEKVQRRWGGEYQKSWEYRSADV